MTPDPYSPASIAREDERREHDCFVCGGTGDCVRCDGSGLDCDCRHGLCDHCDGTGRAS